MRSDDEQGQASVEWVAVVALVAVLFAAGLAIAHDGVAATVVNRVGAAVRLALCEVTGTACADVLPQACTLRERGRDAQASVQVLVLRAGAHGAITRTVKSDGTIEVTFVEGLDPGVGLLLGAEGHLSAGEARGRAATVTAAEVRALGERSRTWKVRSEAEAAALERRLYEVAAGHVSTAAPVVGPLLKAGQELVGRGTGVALPRPSSTTVRGGVTAKVAGGLEGLGDAEWKGAAVVGRTTDHETGGHAVLVELGQEASAAFTLGVAGTGGAGGKVVVKLAFDRAGRPLVLETSFARELRGHLDVAGVAARLRLPPAVAQRLKAAVAGGSRAYETSARLDLTGPAAAAEVEQLLGALRSGRLGDAAAGAMALGRAIAERGAVDVQHFTTDRKAYGAGGALGAGVKGGLEAEVSTVTKTLSGAWSRPPGGVWEERLDCISPARTA